MADQNYIIGVDIGTTSTKSVLFTEAGKVVGKALVTYPLYTPDVATAEQDPEEILTAVVKTVQKLMEAYVLNPSQVLGLCFSSAMHSLILIDAAGQPLTPSITWADNRSAGWEKRIKADMEGHAVYRRTGTPIHPMSPLVKLAWLRHEQPELFQSAARFISIKEYVFYRLLGRYVVDHSIATAMGLLNLETLDWDPGALAIAGVSPSSLSELVPTTAVLTGLKPEMANAMGLREETPIIAGSSDGVLSNLGVGAIASGLVAVTVGTSGAVRAVVDRPITDPQERLFCYPLTEHHWVIGGAVNNGGIALRWVRDQLADAEVATAKRLGQDVYGLLTKMAAAVPAGSEGLLFHPYLMGERSPLWNANARASFFGLSVKHTKSHLVRAVLEGIVYNLYLVLKALEDFAGPATLIQATGGFAESPLWRQMMADIFNREVKIPEHYESSCLGAAVLGLHGLGRVPSLDMVSTMIGATYRHQPIPENVTVYKKVLPVFEHLTEVLAREYDAIAALQAELGDIDLPSR
ncbi:gluconokinase [Leptolyngbya sp. KIOST-1]|uniref:gluconokinase n=1 Tax=Leptolyngbya sp. KIOST-1 TaxID=1229172 RepID=UPI00055A6094|nr:gluconokinase [Leptolyngbya sp. KIOST-1]